MFAHPMALSNAYREMYSADNLQTLLILDDFDIIAPNEISLGENFAGTELH